MNQQSTATSVPSLKRPNDQEELRTVKKTRTKDEPVSPNLEQSSPTSLHPDLEKMKKVMTSALELWKDDDPGYKDLQHRIVLLENSASGNPTENESLRAPFHPPKGTDPLGPLTATFNTLENLRRQVVGDLHSDSVPSPSVLCVGKNWHAYQLKDGFQKRNERPLGKLTSFLPLEVMHEAFYQFSRTLDSALADLQRDIDFQPAQLAAFNLSQTMPMLFADHNSRAEAFLEGLKEIFPEDERHKWSHDKRQAALGRTSVDLVYTVDSVPVIMIEVKLELGSGGDPHIQLQAYYDIYLRENSEIWKTGAPMFLITLSGMSNLVTLSSVLFISPQVH